MERDAPETALGTAAAASPQSGGFAVDKLDWLIAMTGAAGRA
jgi:hypothetical protein